MRDCVYDNCPSWLLLEFCTELQLMKQSVVSRASILNVKVSMKLNSPHAWAPNTRPVILPRNVDYTGWHGSSQPARNSGMYLRCVPRGCQLQDCEGFRRTSCPYSGAQGLQLWILQKFSLLRSLTLGGVPLNHSLCAWSAERLITLYLPYLWYRPSSTIAEMRDEVAFAATCLTDNWQNLRTLFYMV